MKAKMKWVFGTAMTAVAGTLVAVQGWTVEAAPVVHIKLGMWASSPAEKQLVQRQINAFEKVNPDIKVSIQVINGNYLQVLQPMLASHTAPDIFYVDSSYAPTLEASGTLMPLTSYLQRDKVNTQDFSPSLLKAFQWKGVTYGLPKDMNTMAIEYNLALFAKAGIKTPPKTWLQFERDASIFQRKGIKPLSMPIDIARFYPFIADFGGSFYDDMANKATFTDPKNVQGLQFFLNNLENKNIVTPQDTGATWPGEAFARGQVAMAAEGAWIVPFMQQTAPKLKYGVSDFPSINGKDDNMVFTVSYSMAKASSHPAEAAKLLFYMTGQQALKMTADSGLAIPSRKSEQGEFLMKYPSYKAFVDGVRNAIPYQFGTLGQSFLDAINNETQAGELKKLSPTTVLQKAQSTFKSQSQY